MSELYTNREKTLTATTPNDNRKTRLKSTENETPTLVRVRNTGAGDLTLSLSDMDDPSVGNNSHWGDDITIEGDGGSYETTVSAFTFVRVVRIADTSYTVYAEYAG